MSSVTERVREYWNRASCGTGVTSAPKYSREYFAVIEEYRYRYEPFIHAFAQFTRWHGARVLEVGVGAGTDFLQWVRAGAEAHGVDLTEEAIRNVEHRLAVNGLGAASLRCCNAQTLPFDDDSFDLVYSWGVIHHAESTEAVLAEIYRVARPGGRVKIMVYNLQSVWAWWMYARHALLRGKPHRGRRWAIGHYQESYGTRAFSEREIRRMLAPYPHDDLRFFYFEQHVRPDARLARLRRWIDGIRPARWRYYMAFEFDKAKRCAA
jgi:ubiquinone/menaquinone biosynthesis C-methylase UbiE